ncbi:catalase CatB [Streptomyces olivaceus]|uniref:Catalase n=1 Tax=Streptomyces olivaceus TaxID=47716 RepID=A0ABS7W1E0_STROV|nr:catalase CatB [Streptomyces olivaceus]MBZ6088206.1 catalase CatB [Streptomyces olivaceus]MBZ6094958.1 catalase CatB [Streptomyces olivaceus]MBZ6116345.1 catalase CatB [Streptomyces olivaceus]MBZ6151050.1 catalase CatB [Streptomyces olivaceus]MBZ6297364.1 catalase CatB [Streptomyces olivaceus]
MSEANPLKRAAHKVAESLQGEGGGPPDGIPGRPSPESPPVAQPTEPREPLPPKPDQSGPDTVSPTGQPTGADQARVAQSGAYLTDAQGTRLYDTDHSLKAGPRGPVLLQDHHLREKVMHFDHERIPERVVHARGAGAHGVFQSYGTAASVTKAGFLAADVETPVFTRFSTVVGSRGSSDTVRDTRGFATKFYTSEGVFDLVGNNIPVFFIQDAIKFPDVVHAAKPHPDREIPQAQSAHDSFWDFVSLHTEATHHTIFFMGDRGIPRSYRMMEGFGVHTFRLVNAEGATTLVKFHWKPKLGVHSLVWDEAQLTNGVDPDFHRRDLADAIEAGAYPQWELGIQTFPDNPEQTFEGIDLLDPTNLVPEELAPVQPVGLLTLDRNPSNYFAETEQIAFHVGHLVPGIDVTDDPLLAGRLFSYLDTQLTRLGGPNFPQLPINRPQAPVNDMLRDGMHQTAVHRGVAPYRPNSLDGGCPFTAGADMSAFVEAPVRVPEGRKVREAPESFADHFSQPRRFWLSMSPVEREHIIGAYTFELAKCYEQAIRERTLQVLANIDPELCAGVAEGLGLPAPAPTVPLADVEPSPALSQVGGTWPLDGRVVGIVTGGADLEGVGAVREAVLNAGMVPLVVAPTGGTLGSGDAALTVQRSYVTARSVEFDAVLLAGAPDMGGDAYTPRDYKAGPAPAGQATIDPRVSLLVSEAFRHGKAIGVWAGGETALEASGVPAGSAGVVVAESGTAALEQVTQLMGSHRVWERFTTPRG